MPFKVITTVEHYGPPDPLEKLTVHTTTGEVVMATRRDNGFKRYYIPAIYWPRSVSNAVDGLIAEGKVTKRNEVTVWINMAKSPRLLVGEEIHLDLSYSDSFPYRELMTLSGIVTGFSVPEDR